MSEKRLQMNLQALLRFALEQTKSEDAKEPQDTKSTTSSFGAMDEERKQFLQSAFKAMTVDVMEEFEKAIAVLENPKSTTLDKLNALTIVREDIEHIDFANNFVKVGGGDILLKHLKAPESQIRALVIYIIAEMAQNNPFCQKHFTEADVLRVLVSYYNEKNENVASSSVYATSAIVRNSPACLIEFLKIGGLKFLVSVLNTDYPRVFIKATFLIGNLAVENAEVRDELAKQHTIEKLFDHLEPTNEFDVKIETVLFALSELTKSNDWKPTENIQEEMTDLLNTLVDQNKELPHCEEMVAYAKAILHNLEEHKQKQEHQKENGQQEEMRKLADSK